MLAYSILDFYPGLCTNVGSKRKICSLSTEASLEAGREIQCHAVRTKIPVPETKVLVTLTWAVVSLPLGID